MRPRVTVRTRAAPSHSNSNPSSKMFWDLAGHTVGLKQYHKHLKPLFVFLFFDQGHHFSRPDAVYITRPDKITAQRFMATTCLINLLSTTKM